MTRITLCLNRSVAGGGGGFMMMKDKLGEMEFLPHYHDMHYPEEEGAGGGGGGAGGGGGRQHGGERQTRRDGIAISAGQICKALI